MATRDGLSVVSADEKGGRLLLDFRRDGRVIHFDLRLGPEMEIKPDVITEETPTHQVDARVTDAKFQALNRVYNGLTAMTALSAIMVTVLAYARLMQ